MYVYPFIDQEWVIENIDHVMKEFLKIHPEFRGPGNASMSAKSRHKRNMMKNMDTMRFRHLPKVVQNTAS